jgi:hypothetical protein
MERGVIDDEGFLIGVQALVATVQRDEASGVCRDHRDRKRALLRRGGPFVLFVPLFHGSEDTSAFISSTISRRCRSFWASASMMSSDSA